MGDFTPLVIDVILWGVLYVVWLGSAFFVKKSKVSENFWIGRLRHGLPLVLGFYLIFHHRKIGLLAGRLYQNNVAAWMGVMVTTAGIAFAIWARFTLGRNWSGIITLKEGHRLIRAGPYKIARHPIYTGFSLAALGTAVSAASIDAFIGYAVITFSFVVKLRLEERLLIGEFGDEYRQYRREVPAIYPLLAWLHTSPIESDAFSAAVLRSDRYRIIGMLCVAAGFSLLCVASILAEPRAYLRYLIFISWWAILAAYEILLLRATGRAQRRGTPTRRWVWILNTTIECLLPSLALLGLTGDKSYLGPYRALASSAVGVYYIVIILSTLRLDPILSLMAGGVCAAGYVGVYIFTLNVAPNNDYRHFMPERTYYMTPLMVVGAGLVAAAIARQIRQHVIAALAEAETRRKLDRIEHDLSIARSIQMGLLPKNPPAIPGYDTAGWSQPADQTGGDYYDWIELPGGRVLFTLADATGHGIGPALLVAACRAYFRAIASKNDPLERIAAQVDELIAADVPDGRFITAVIALLDPATHTLSLYSAGHAPLYFYSARDNRITTFDADQPPLGLRCNLDSVARTLAFNPGDALVLVTDGFFECPNAAGEQLGTRGLADSILRHCAANAAGIIERIRADVLAFTQSTPQADDMSAVIIKRS